MSQHVDNMTRAQLVAVAEKLGIADPDRLTSATLKTTIKNKYKKQKGH